MQAAPDRNALPPVELWLFVAGSAAYTAVPLVMPGFPYVPANPAALFAVVTGLILMFTRTRRSYWVTLTLAFLAVAYPLLVLDNWRKGFDPGLAQTLWVFGVPAGLACLLRTARLRRFTLDGSPVEPSSDPESTADGGSGAAKTT
jgi:hypothetical protein